jgi:hypothetical protein
MLEEQLLYVANLSEEVKDIIREYTGNEYNDLNYRLRNNMTLTSRQQYIVEKLDYAFALCPNITDNIVVYRGINTKDFVSGLSSYISTTYDIDIAHKYSCKGCATLHIVVPSGSKVLPLEFISEYKSEKEILLPRAGNLLTTNYTYANNIIIYNLVYVPPESIVLNNTTTSDEVLHELTINQWVDRVLELFTEEELEIYDTVEDIINSYKELYFKDIPDEAVNIAIHKIKILYNL